MVYRYEPLAEKVKILVEANAFDEAIGLYVEALNTDIDNVDALNDLGNLYSRKEELEKAKEYYFKAYELNPNVGRTLHNIGATYYRKKDIDNALIYLNKAISQEPSFGSTLALLGTIYRDTKQFNKAYDYILKSGKYEDPYDTALRLVKLYEKQEDWNEAINLLSSIEALVPEKQMDAYFYLQMRYHLKLKKYGAAWDYSLRYVETNLSDVELYEDVVDLFIEHRWDKATRYFLRRAIELNPQGLKYWDRLTAVYEITYDWPEKVLELCRMGALKFPNETNLPFKLSHRLFKHISPCQLQEALECGDKLIHRNEPDYQLLLGYYYCFYKKKDASKKYFNKAIQQAQNANSPDFDIHLLELSDFLKEKGEIKLSKAARKKAYRIRDMVEFND